MYTNIYIYTNKTQTYMYINIYVHKQNTNIYVHKENTNIYICTQTKHNHICTQTKTTSVQITHSKLLKTVNITQNKMMYVTLLLVINPDNLIPVIYLYCRQLCDSKHVNTKYTQKMASVA